MEMNTQLGRQLDKQETKNICTYGSVAAAESQRLAPGEKEWHQLGSPVVLLMSSGVVFGRQCVALGIILASVFYSHEYLMTCDSRQVGFAAGALCEYTKAYVRCFPLLALVVSLMVTCRQILQHRLYYVLLKHGVVQDIENFSPLADPLFLIVVWCAINAAAHFCLTIHEAHGMHFNKQVQDQIKRVAVFYLVPTGLFMMFLYAGYDLEATLLPLNKYFDEDPAEARRALGTMPFLQEPASAFAVNELNEQEGGPSVHLEEAIRQVTKLAEAKMQEAEVCQDVIPPLSRWRLMGCMWPAKFLLHRNRVDMESTNFRHAWYLIGACTMCVILAVLFLFVRTTFGKIDDVASGQREDLFGLIVTLLHVGLTIRLAVGLLENIVPFHV
jgi:hypothetical protein